MADRLSVALQGRYLVIHGDGCDSEVPGGTRASGAPTCSWPPPARDDDNLRVVRRSRSLVFQRAALHRAREQRRRTSASSKVGIECVSSTPRSLRTSSRKGAAGQREAYPRR